MPQIGASLQCREAAQMARKPNYRFERMERDRLKAAESAKKAQAKLEKKAMAAGEKSGASDEEA